MLDWARNAKYIALINWYKYIKQDYWLGYVVGIRRDTRIHAYTYMYYITQISINICPLKYFSTQPRSRYLHSFCYCLAPWWWWWWLWLHILHGKCITIKTRRSCLRSCCYLTFILIFLVKEKMPDEYYDYAGQGS